MEDILAVLLIFGGATVVALSMSPVGRAIAARIQGAGPGAAQADDLKRAVESSQAALDEIEGMRRDITELQERVDFAERMLARQREEPRLGQGG